MQISRRIKAIIALSLLALAVLLVGLWFYNHSYIQVTIEGSNSNTEATFTLRDQSSGETTDVRAVGGFTRLVARSSYEVSIKQRDSSFFAVTTTKGFLNKTVIQARLQTEKNRQFVGNNPDPCMAYLKTVLVSFACNTAYNQAQTHVRATSKEPTYTLKQTLASEASLVNIIKTRNATVAFLEEALQGDEPGYTHMIYTLDDSLTPVSEKVLGSLTPAKNYDILPHRDGFLVYSTDFEEVWRYENITSDPSRLTLTVPEDDDLSPFVISSRGNAFVVGYTDSDEEDDLHGEESTIHNQFIVHSGGQPRAYAIDGQFSSVLLCGTNKLCLQSGDQLEVYDISSNKAKRLFRVTHVQSIESFGETLLVINDAGVLRLDVNAQQGWFDYSFGDYTYCGFADNVSSYVLCLINPAQEKVALLINPAQPDADAIDKKILELRQVEGVVDLSVYENYIYFVPDTGELIYDEQNNEFTFDPQLINSITTAFNNKAAELKLDRGKYTIINALQ